MIGSSNSLFGGMPDATSVLEQERPFATSVSAENKMDSSIASAFMGSTENQTANFAQALSATTETTDTTSYDTEDFAHALNHENSEAITNSTPTPEYPVFDIAERAHTKDMEDLAMVQAQIAELTAELTRKVLEAKAQDPLLAREEEKILMAQQTETEGVYLINFLHRLIQNVDRSIKSTIQLAVTSARQSGSWAETARQHSRMRDEHRLQSQAAG